MAYKAKKTEHSGSKKGRGAYYGRKRDAKRESARARRRSTRKLTNADTPADRFLTIGARSKSSPMGRTTHGDIDAVLYGRTAPDSRRWIRRVPKSSVVDPKP